MKILIKLEKFSLLIKLLNISHLNKKNLHFQKFMLEFSKIEK